MKSGLKTASFTQVSITLLGLALFTACSSAPSQKPISKKDRIEGLLNIAGANIQENDGTGALIALNELREIDDTIPEEYYLYALAYLQKKELKLAVESARRAVKLAPKFSAAKNTLGKLLMDQGKLQEAEPYLKEAANDLVFRDAYLAKINLGILYYKKLDLNRSKTLLTDAIDDGGALNCMAHYYRGKINLEQNALNEAERDFSESTKGACSAMTEAHVAFGTTLVREKKYDQARAKFIDIQKLFPSTTASDQATQYLREIP